MKSSGFSLPDWLLNLKNPSKEKKKRLKKFPIKRKGIDEVSKSSRNLLRAKGGADDQT
jgi:ATP-dependent RNA helicase DDX52/ROK1